MSEVASNWKDFINGIMVNWWINGQLGAWQSDKWDSAAPSTQDWVGDWKKVNKKVPCGVLYFGSCDAQYVYTKHGLRTISDGFFEYNYAKWKGLDNARKADFAVKYLDKEANLETNLSRIDSKIFIDKAKYGEPIIHDLPRPVAKGSVLENTASIPGIFTAEVEVDESWSWSNDVSTSTSIGASVMVGAEVKGKAGVPFLAEGEVTVKGEISSSIQGSYSYSKSSSNSGGQVQTHSVGFNLDPGQKVRIETVVYRTKTQLPYSIPVELKGKAAIKSKGKWSAGRQSKGWDMGIGYWARDGAYAGWIDPKFKTSSGEKLNFNVDSIFELEDYSKMKTQAYDITEDGKSIPIDSIPKNNSVSLRTMRGKSGRNFKELMHEWHADAQSDAETIKKLHRNISDDLPAADTLTGESNNKSVYRKELIGDYFDHSDSNQSFIGSRGNDMFLADADADNNYYVGGHGDNYYQLGDYNDFVFAKNNGGHDHVIGGRGSTRVHSKNANPYFLLGKGSDFVKMIFTKDATGMVDLGKDSKRDELLIDLKSTDADVSIFLNNFNIADDGLKIQGIKDVEFNVIGSFLEIHGSGRHVMTIADVSDNLNDLFVVDSLNQSLVLGHFFS